MVRKTGEENDVGVRDKYDIDGLLGLVMILLGLAIVITYGRFFIGMAHNTILFVGLSLFSTALTTLIKVRRDNEPDLSDIYVFICMLTRLLNYMILTIAGYSVGYKFIKLIFPSILGEFGELGGLNLGILVFSAIVPYLLQKLFVRKVFKVDI